MKHNPWSYTGGWDQFLSIDTATVIINALGWTYCSHMLGVCIGGRYPCGFKNDSLGENFCNWNRYSFLLMVRCGIVFLQGDFNVMVFLRFARLLPCLLRVLAPIKTLTRHFNWPWPILIISFFSSKRGGRDFIIIARVKQGLGGVRFGL